MKAHDIFGQQSDVVGFLFFNIGEYSRVLRKTAGEVGGVREARDVFVCQCEEFTQEMQVAAGIVFGFLRDNLV